MRWSLLASLLLAASAAAQPRLPDATLTSPDAGFGVEFGRALSADGAFVAVGAPGAEQGDREPGAVTVFERLADGSWVQRQRIVPSDFAGGRFNERERFGETLSLDGDRLAISARDDDGDDGTRNIGAVYVYERQPDDTWAEVAKLREPAPYAFGRFGRAVALDGDRLVASAFGDPRPDGYEGGSVFVFDRQPDGSWTSTTTLRRPVSGPIFFGTALALDGDRILASSSNRAYLYDLLDGTWTEVADLEAPDPQVFNFPAFGESVALDGDRALVGDPQRTITYPDGTFATGAAYLFEPSGGTWTATQRFLPDDLDRPDLPSGRQIDFGAAVALAGDLVAIGAPEDYVGEQFNAGAVTVFEAEDGAWTRVAKLGGAAPGAAEQYGWSVALTGRTVIGGAINGGGGDEPGIAYVHDVEGGTPGPLALFVSETVGVRDAPRLRGPLALFVAETIGVRDSPGLRGALALFVAERIGVSDAPGVARDGAAAAAAPVRLDTDLVRFLGPVGLSVAFAEVGVPGAVSVGFEAEAPEDPVGIPADATLAPYRWSLQAADGLAFGEASVAFDPAALPNLDVTDPSAVVVYRRPTPGMGGFEPLPTAIDPDTGEIVGSGLTAFSEFALAGGLAVDADDAAPATFGLSRPAPNPASGTTRLVLSLATAGPARVDLLDALGRRVGTLVDGALPAGETALDLDASRLAAGVYVVVFRAEGQMATARLTVVR